MYFESTTDIPVHVVRVNIPFLEILNHFFSDNDSGYWAKGVKTIYNW